MSKNGILVVVFLAVLVGLFFLLGGPGAFFGKGDVGIDGGSVNAPEKAPARAPDAAAGGAAGGAGAKASPERGATLFGRPRADRKGVGALVARVVRWKDQTPVVGAVFLLTGEGNGGEEVNAKATTDAKGTGSMPSVPAGDAYVLRVEAKDEPPTLLPGIEVAAGATRDLGTIFVGKKSGLFGRVVDDQDKPVAGADVRAYPGYGGLFDMMSNMMDIIMTLDREPTPLAKTTSDAKGEFTIPDLSPGPLVVRATSPGKRQALKQVKLGSEGAIGGALTLVLDPGLPVAGIVVDSAGTPVPGAQLSLMAQGSGDPDDLLFGRTFAVSDANGRFRVFVPEGSERFMAFVAAAGFPTAISPAFRAGDESVRIVLKGGARIELSVVEAETNRPIPGATVMLAMGEPADNQMEKGGGFVVVTTDAQGMASAATRPGTLQMGMVTAPGHGGGMFGGGQDAAAAQMLSGGIQHDFPARLEEGQTAKATIKLSAGFAMKGRVKDGNGAGIAGAELKVVGIMGGGATSTRSASDGSYRLTGLTPMSMSVVVRAPGWAQENAGGMGMFGGLAGAMEDPEPKPGVDIEKDFVMRPSVTVRGRVVDADGNGIAGAQVKMAAGFDFSDLMAGKAAGGISAADGSYVLFDVDPEAGNADMMAAQVVAPPEEPVPPPQVDPPAEPGQPPPNLKARLADGKPAAPPDKKKNLRVRAESDGWVAASSEAFDAKGGTTVTAPPIRLTRGAVLTGVVKDPSGGAVRGAHIDVSVQADDGNPMDMMSFSRAGKDARNVRSAGDGTFKVDTLPKGTVTLTVSAEGFAGGRRSVKVEALDAKPTVEVRLRPGVALRGRVVGSDGRPVEGARVQVDDSALEGETGEDAYLVPLSGKTDKDGGFTLSPLPQGRVKVTVSAEGRKTLTTALVTGGTSSDVVLENRSPADAKRLKEVDEEISALSMKYATAKTDADRQALMAKMTDLMREKRELQKDAGSTAPDVTDK